MKSSFTRQLQEQGWTVRKIFTTGGKRPQLNVVPAEDEVLGPIVVKQYDPRTDDGYLGDRGPQTGFVRSLVVPRAAVRVAERQGLMSVPIVKVLDRFHLSLIETDGYPWYFAMPFYQETLDWSVVGDVRDALQAISDVQRIDVKDLQREMDSMEDLPRWAQCSAQFGSADVGTFLRYSGNIGDSVSGLVCSGYNRESGYRTILRELVRHGHECLRQALSTDIEAPLVLSHRDTGIPNFRKDGAGQLVLIDWEHCRIDNPLSDYTHLWLQLAGDDLDESAATVFEFIKDRFSEKAWFDVTLRLCVAEKFLGNTNHKVTYSKTAEAAVRAVSAGLERMEWALAEVNG